MNSNILTNNSTDYTWSTTSSDYVLGNSVISDVQSNTLSVKGSANITVDGDLKIQGRSILESLERIESRLGILVPEPLKPDEKLLVLYKELQEAKKAYLDLESQFNLAQVLKS